MTPITTHYRPPSPSIWRDVCALLPDVRIADAVMLAVFPLAWIAAMILEICYV